MKEARASQLANSSSTQAGIQTHTYTRYVAFPHQPADPDLVPSGTLSRLPELGVLVMTLS